MHVLPGAHKVIARGRAYWYAWRGGPQIWAGAAADVEACAAEIVDAYHDVIRGRAAKGTIARLVMDYKASPEFATLALSTRALYHDFLDRLSEKAGPLSLDEFNGKGGRALIREWRSEVSPRTADQVRSIIGALSTWARQTDNADRDFRPTADMPGLYSAPPQAAWSREDVDKAMTGLPPHLSRVVALALNTGLRRADLCALTWAAVDDAAGVIRWHTSKGRKHRRLAIIPLTPALRMALRRCPRGEAVTILTNSFGKPWKPTGLASSMDAALARLKVVGTLHGLRRASATHLAAQGLSSRQIAVQLGWSEREAESMAATYVNEEAAAAERTETRS